MSFKSEKKIQKSWIMVETETRRGSLAAGVGSVMDGRQRTPPWDSPGSFLSVVQTA